MAESESFIDIWDAVAIGAVVLAVVLYLLKGKSSPKPNPKPSTVGKAPVSKADKSFIGKMKNANKNVIVFYGSQTGTAEEFANRLVKEADRLGFHAMSADLEDYDLADLDKFGQIHNGFALFCMATYGEGDPTDNAQTFYTWLQEESEGTDLSGLKYAVFGLGNKTYEHYNSVGINVDLKLEELGATRLCKVGLGDDDGNLEEDFSNWKEAMWQTVCDFFGVERSSTSGPSERRFKLGEVSTTARVVEGNLTSHKVKDPANYESQRGPFDAKNPFMSKVVSTRELHTKLSDRSCIHAEFDLGKSGIKYEAGDHCAVFPRNNSKLVESIGSLLDQDLDQVFTLVAVDESSSKKHPFPCPTTYRNALTHFLDITSSPRPDILREFAEYATNEEQRNRLLFLASKDGRAAYHDYILDKHRIVTEVLKDFNSVRISLDHLCELLPRLQPRYYSISSSSKAHPLSVHITAVVVKWKTPTNRDGEGVATNYIAGLKVGEFVPIYIRKATNFKLPKSPATPIVMIGPGTGLAPFRGFLQDRMKMKETGAPVGDTVLYFGCRHPDHDYLYREELEAAHQSKVLSNLHLAFSRHTGPKVYVQDIMVHQSNKDELWRIMESNGHIYVCGDAKNMAHSVHSALEEIIREKTNGNENSAKEYIKRLQKEHRYSQDVW